MRAGTVILYLGLGAAYAYLGWNEPYSWWVVSGFLLLHVGVGFAIGRWWACLLPLGWALVAVSADGYDTPLHIIILFQTPLFWGPALALGVLFHRLGDPIRRSLPLRSTTANSRMPNR